MISDRRVLVVDSGRSVAEALAAALAERREDVHVDVATTTTAGIDHVESTAYDVVVAAVRKSDSDGGTFLSSVRQRRPTVPLVAITDGDVQTARRALSRGATDFVRREQVRADSDSAAARVVARAQTESEASNDRQFRTYIQHSTDVVTELDADGIIRYVSPSFERIFGYDQTELVGEAAIHYIHPDEREEVLDVFEEVLSSSGEPFTVSFRFRHADGSWRDVESVGVNRLEDPDVGAILVNTRDVTERKRRAQVLEGLHDAATDIEAADTVKAVCEETVETAANILDFDLCVINLEEDGLLPIVAVSDSTPPDGANPMSVEEGLVGKTYRTGESLLVNDVSNHPEANPQGPYESAISVPIADYGVFQTVSHDRDAFDEQDLDFAELLVSHTAQALTRVHNASDLRERERELRRQNERLERFASVVSHDLRSPMSVARGRLELAQDACDSEHLDEVSQSLSRMGAIVDDVLTLAREGDTVEDPATVSLRDVAALAWDTIASESATLDLSDVEGAVRAEESRLHRLFSNLFVNAVEHAGADATVRVGTLPDGFYVADDGPGIPREHREVVFDAGYSTTESGTGLGLNIVREIAEAHGWTVDVTDSRDGGVCVEVTGVEWSDTRSDE